MILSSITGENTNLFEGIVPDYLLAEIDEPFRFGLGLIEEAGEGKEERAVGALLFDTDEGEEPFVWLVWLYVAEDYRQKGVADRLMDEFLSIIEQIGYETVICDVPMPENYNLLVAYLEAWSFQFALIDVPELLLRLGDFKSAPKIATLQELDAVHSLKKVSGAAFHKYIVKATELEDVDVRLTDDVTDYDTQVSCYCEEDGEVVGALLIKKLTDHYIEVRHLRILAKSAKLVGAMIARGVRKASEIYGEDVWVSIPCATNAAAELLEYLFPDREALRTRRGVLHIEDLYDIEEDMQDGNE